MPVRTDSGGGRGESQDNPTGVENAISSWQEIMQCFWAIGVLLGRKSHGHHRFLKRGFHKKV